MKKLQQTAIVLLALSFAISVFCLVGCKKSDNTVTPVASLGITVDLFPLTVGHKITYTGYLRSIGTDTNITLTGAVYATSWTVLSNSQATPIGGTSTLIYDSTTVPTGIANPPVTIVATPLFVQRASATGSGNFSFLQNIGLFYRTFGLVRADSLRWILIGKLDAGVGSEWTAFDSTWTTGLGQTELKIVGLFVDQEAITVGGQSFDTYKLTLTQKVLVGGSVTATAPLATFWLAAGIGPVKMILNASTEANGHYREFKSKNF